LGELVENFKQKGHGEVADSWVGHGPNRQIEPHQLEQAIGPDVLETLSQQTGLSRDELLSRLSTTLPEAVDKYTPEGRLRANPSSRASDRQHRESPYGIIQVHQGCGREAVRG
jgi:uncharacterized protein YidB (DUF937 family)